LSHEEDYEGMVKASALDRTPEHDPQYYWNYDNYTGWGFLKADKIYSMFNDGYLVSHYSSDESMTFSDWSDWETYGFFNEGLTNKYLQPGRYNIRKRAVSGFINLPDNWTVDENIPLYVWGRSNRNGKGGYDASEPNYQERYTQVISGTGGNGFIDGIIHSHSLDVEAITYQYDVYDLQNNYIGHIPPDDDLALNISVFGIQKPLNVKNIGNENPYKISLYPNPASDILYIGFELSRPASVQIIIYDVLCNPVRTLSSEIITARLNSEKANLSGLSPGVYYCAVMISGKVYSTSFVITK